MNIHDQDTFRRSKQEGSHEKALESARKLLLKNVDIAIISDYTGLLLETIKKLDKNINQ